MPKLITDLAIMLLTAGVVTVIFKKIKQPLVLGYIAAGFLIGPYMPYFFTVEDMSAITTWSEIGIIILMFGLGLEFNLHKLFKVGGTAIVTAMTEVLGMLVLGFGVGQALGWSTMDSVFLGGMLSMSSTTIIIKAFDELGVRQESYAQLVFGTLVVEDIAGIFMMIILSTISVSQSITGADLAMKLGVLVLYLAVWLILGIYLLPTLLNRVSHLMNDETLLITSLGVCFGMVLLAEAIGFSSALGAFLAGSLLAGTVHAERVEHLSSGVKDLFGCVFFLSVGMMLDPAMVVKYIVPILIITLVTVVGKLAISSQGVILAGQPLEKAIHCGCSLAQIGEFAFIIASLGMSLGVIADYVYPIIVSVSVITTLTTPFFIKNADKIYETVAKILPEKYRKKLDRLNTETQADPEQESNWVVFLRRYIKVTVLYGVIMLGISVIGQKLLLPFMLTLPVGPVVAKTVTIVAICLGIALFTRPMMDLHSPEYTRLWLSESSYRLPLAALNAIRLLLIILLVFSSVYSIAKVDGLWLLPLTAAAVLLTARSGVLSSAYLSVESRFLSNFNERQLQKFDGSGEDNQWLDEKLRVLEFTCDSEALGVGKTLKALKWGSEYGVNVIKIVRGKRHYNMPSGKFPLRSGDRIYTIGETDELKSFRAGLGLEEGQQPTLREFSAAQENKNNALFACALSVEANSELEGKTVRESGLRENYDCIILGIQRGADTLLQPEVDTAIKPGDLIWVLGTRNMAGKLLSGDMIFKSR